MRKYDAWHTHRENSGGMMRVCVISDKKNLLNARLRWLSIQTSINRSKIHREKTFLFTSRGWRSYPREESELVNVLE